MSSGLALTAQAVADCDDDGFEFLSIEEIREYCPGMFLIVNVSVQLFYFEFYVCVCMYVCMYVCAYMNIGSM